MVENYKLRVLELQGTALPIPIYGRRKKNTTKHNSQRHPQPNTSQKILQPSQKSFCYTSQWNNLYLEYCHKLHIKINISYKLRDHSCKGLLYPSPYMGGEVLKSVRGILNINCT